MKIIYETEDINKWHDELNSSVIAMGSFDGIHLGHSKIISFLKEKAKKYGTPSVVLTYHPHPYIYFHPDEPFLLTNREEKAILLYEKEVDYLVYLPFNPSIANLSPNQFVENVLIDKFSVSAVVVGVSHRFGHNRMGDHQILKKLGKEHGFDVNIIEPVVMDDVMITSTQIRKKIKFGDIETANLMLGHPYTITGLVKEGRRIGSNIGFPTINLDIEQKNKLLPLRGVYGGIVEVNEERHFCMVNVGDNPTLNRKDFMVEAHILDFSGNLYGARVSIKFYFRIRDELKFSSMEKLKEQLLKDKETVKQKLKRRFQ